MNFTQWRTGADRGELRRVTWVCGEQRVLVEEVVDTTRSAVGASVLDSLTFTAGEDPDREIWAAANQYPLDPGAQRLILVRAAQKLRHWAPLHPWLASTRQLPGVHLLFVSDDADIPQVSAPGKKVTAPHIEVMKAPRGHVVRCSTPNADDAVAWVCRQATVDTRTAQHLLTRVGGDLVAAKAVCGKLGLFPGVSAGSRAVDALVTQMPGLGFVDALLDVRRPEALLCLPGLTDGERLRVIGLLDHRLDLLATLHRHIKAGLTQRDIQGVPHFLVRQYWFTAKHYDTAQCAYRRRLLAVIDDALRSGARTGAFEALVALW